MLACINLLQNNNFYISNAILFGKYTNYFIIGSYCFAMFDCRNQ